MLESKNYNSKIIETGIEIASCFINCFASLLFETKKSQIVSSKMLGQKER